MDGNEQARSREVRPVGRTDLAPAEEQSVGELFARLSDDVTTLIRQEAALARAEVAEKISQFGRGTAYTVAAGIVLYTGVIALIYAAIQLLGLAIPVWAAALIVAAGVLLAGGILLRMGLTNLARSSSLPERTMDSVMEDTELVREQLERRREHDS